ncbi:hypothetical protein ABIB18_004547 [Pantoea sp. UYEF8]
MLQSFTELNVSLHLSINSQAAALFTLIALKKIILLESHHGLNKRKWQL